jgi:small ligand-binding sensory domain FIST
VVIPTGTTARCHAALSVHPLTAAATGEVVGEVLEAMGPGADVAVITASGSHVESIGAVVSTVRSMLGVDVVLWAAATGVIGGSRGIEDGAGLALFVARTGPVVPVELSISGDAPDAPDEPDRRQLVGAELLPEVGTLVLIGDGGPSSLPGVLDLLARQRPDLVVAGGLVPARLASGLVARSGLVTLSAAEAMSGEPSAPPADGSGSVVRGVVFAPGTTEVVVSQGCRAIGDPLVITRARGPIIEELAGQPALDRVDALVAALSTSDRALAAQYGLQLGWVVDERAADPGPGDVLVRNVVGAVKGTRAMAVDDHLPVGALVQFHLRDSDAAAGQLRSQLGGHTACGALVFTCNGRGTALFPTADHDPGIIVDQVGPAVAGMFCAGEIGPVGGRSWLHSLTATTVLIRP